MRYFLLIIAVVALVGCGELKEQKAAEDKAAAPKRAVAVAKEVQCRFCENIFPAADISRHELKCPKNATDQSLKPANHPAPNPKQPKTTSEKLIADPIVEKAIRGNSLFGINKPTGELTEADLAKVTLLSLSLTKITDEGLKELAKLQNLKGLDLGLTKITDENLKEVAKLQQLEALHLTGTKITDAGLKEVAKLQKLKRLYLSHTKITDACLKEVAKLQKLERLTFDGTKVTKAGVAELKKALPKCGISGP